MLKHIVWVLLLVYGIPAYAGGAVYKWVDEQGNIQYRDTPPPGGANYQIIQHPTTGQAPETAISEQQKKTEAADKTKQNQLPQPDAANAQDLEARRAAVCKQAQANLEVLAKSPHPLRTDADGKQSLLTEEQRQEEISKNQKYVQEYCKKP